MDAACAVCRSVPGLVLTGHLLLLVVLSHTSDSAAQGFGIFCVAWPILVPIALVFSVGALRYLIRMPDTPATRRRYLAIVIVSISIVGTLVCSIWFIVVVAKLPNLHN